MKNPRISNGTGMALGIVLGIAIGIATRNVGVGVALAIVFGIGFGAIGHRKPPDRKDGNDDTGSPPP